MSLVRPLAGVAIAAAGILACGSDPTGNTTPVPTSMVLSTNTVSFNALGASQQLTATIRDQNGDPIAGLAATFISSNPEVATASSSGLVTAVGNGSSTVTVSHGTLANQTIAIAVAQVVAEVAKTGGDEQSGLINAQLTTAVEVEIRDARGHPVPGGSVPNTTVQFVAGNGGSVGSSPILADANGRASTTWTLGPGVGAQQLTASIQGGPASTIFSANAVATVAPAIVKIEGDLQFGLVGAPINILPAVRVQDEFGVGVPSAPVTFTVTGGGGNVGGGSATTDAQGIARPASWTLGGSAGDNTIEVTSGSLTPVTFTASGEVAAYDIIITYQAGTNPTAAQQTAINSAVAFWESIIFRDLPSVSLNVDATNCGIGVVNKTIDDIEVFVSFEDIDGPFNTLAQAGRCDSDPPSLRSGGLPVLGILIVDNADLAFMETNGTFEATVTHELGHALGFDNVMFSFRNRLQNPSRPVGLPPVPGANTHFNGPQAIAAMDAVGGDDYVGSKVPLDNSGVAGSADSHWRESVFDAELMTSFAETGPMPLSRVTAAAMLDLGYGVHLAGAQSFTMGATPGLAALRAASRIPLGADVVHLVIPRAAIFRAQQ